MLGFFKQKNEENAEDKNKLKIKQFYLIKQTEVIAGPFKDMAQVINAKKAQTDPESYTVVYSLIDVYTT